MDTGHVFPPAVRLHTAADFAALRGCRRPVRGPCFVLRYTASGRDHARLGMAVSRRVSKRAVERNRIKRVIRESFRRLRHELPAFDVLVIANPVAATTPNRELAEQLARHWRSLCQRGGDTGT